MCLKMEQQETEQKNLPLGIRAKCQQSSVCQFNRENVPVNKTLPQTAGQKWIDRWPQTLSSTTDFEI